MKNRQAGFSLLEVIVALIILGISLGGIFQAISVSRRISVKADETITAVRLAGNIMANPVLIESVVNGKEVSARIDMEPGWRYTLSALPLEFELSSKRDVVLVPSMFELELCLFHQTYFREKAFCLKKWHRR